MMRNKKGSHVGMILSFLIFVTFLGFLYSVTQPLTKVRQDKLDLLGYLKVELIEEFSADLSAVIISMEDLSIPSCLKLESIPGLVNTGVVAKRDDESLMASYFDSTNDQVEIVDEDDIVRLFFSDEFDSGTDLGNCDILIEGTNYNVSLFRTTEELFISKITNMSEYINNGTIYYQEIKTRLGVTLEDNFGFTFSDGDKNFITGTEEKNVSVDVYVEEVTIQYMDNEANINPGFLRIIVW